jgi:hypothetical protein
MAIKISGSTFIDDSRNIVNAGIVTATSFVGELNSSTLDTVDGGAVVTGVLTATTISADKFIGSGDNLIFSPSITSFSPTDGATNVQVNTNIILTFDQYVQAGVGSIFLRNSSPVAGVGTLIQAIGVGSTSVVFNNQTVTIDPPANMVNNTEIFVVIPQGVIENAISGAALSLTTYNFTTIAAQPGDEFGGGYLICQTGGNRYIVAPSSTEVERNWYQRNHAVTQANANAACGDWFVPSSGHLQNPGYVCREHWDSYNASKYWGNNEVGNNDNAYFTNMANGSASFHPNQKPNSLYVRAFRTISY